MSTNEARKVAALTGGKFMSAMGIRGSDHLVAAVSREIDAEAKHGALLLSGEGFSLQVFYGTPVSAGEARAVTAYCKRHGHDEPSYLSLHRPTGSTSGADQPTSGWLPARVTAKGEPIAPVRLEYVAVGCRIEADGPVFRVKVGGREVAILSAFVVAFTRIARWADVVGSPLQSALKITKAEKEGREKDGAKSAMHALIQKYQGTLTVEEMAECLGLPPEAIAAAAK